MECPDWTRPWYHGSPAEMDELTRCSTITQDRELAPVFSHRPTFVCVEDDGRIRHNGLEAGIVYVVSEPLGESDVTGHPNSTMVPGQEWLTTRNLSVTPISRPEILAVEFLTEQEIEQIGDDKTQGSDRSR